MKNFRKSLIFLMLLACMFATPFLSVYASPATAGTNGELVVSSSIVLEGQLLYIQASDLDASATYNITVTVDSTTTTLWEGTTNSGASDIFVSWLSERPTSGSTVTLKLGDDATATIDTLYITVDDIDPYFDTDLFINVAVAVIIVLAIISMIAYFGRSMF